MNWDPELGTPFRIWKSKTTKSRAISGISVTRLQMVPTADGDGFLTVATTRPETMLGDTAVAVHPDDDRYKNLVGQFIDLPSSGAEFLLSPIAMSTWNLVPAA